MTDNITFSSNDLPDHVKQNTEILFAFLLDEGDKLLNGYSEETVLQLVPEALIEALRAGEIDVHAYGATQDSTLLAHAAGQNRLGVCELLIEQHAAIDPVCTDWEFSPLTFTLYGGMPCPDTQKLLLDSGVSCNTRNYAGGHDDHTTLREHIKKATATWNTWQDGSLSADQLTKANVMEMLNVWPLANPIAPVPRFLHLEAIFNDARWKDEHAEHKLDLIQQIPCLSSREQMFLMGGHARKAMQKQSAPTQAQGAER